MSEDLVPINIPYVYLDPSYLFSGTLEEVSARILEIKQKIAEEIKRLNKQNKKVSGFKPYLPISAYEKIHLELHITEYGHDSESEVEIRAYRKITSEEKRLAKEKERKEKLKEKLRRVKISKARKEAARKKKAQQDEKDLALYKKLKKKFEGSPE